MRGNCIERVEHIFLKNNIYVSEDNKQKLYSSFCICLLIEFFGVTKNCFIPSDIIYLFCVQKSSNMAKTFSLDSEFCKLEAVVGSMKNI